MLCSAWVVARCDNRMLDGVFIGIFIAKPQRCSRCGLAGHNARNCPRLGVPRCGHCGSTWHTTRNCRNRDPPYGQPGRRFKVQDRAAIAAYCREERARAIPTVSPDGVGIRGNPGGPRADAGQSAATSPMDIEGASALAGGTTGRGGNGPVGGAEGSSEGGGDSRQWRGRTRTPRARPQPKHRDVPGSCQTGKVAQGRQEGEETEDELRPGRDLSQAAVGWSGKGRRTSRGSRLGGRGI